MWVSRNCDAGRWRWASRCAMFVVRCRFTAGPGTGPGGGRQREPPAGQPLAERGDDDDGGRAVATGRRADDAGGSAGAVRLGGAHLRGDLGRPAGDRLRRGGRGARAGPVRPRRDAPLSGAGHDRRSREGDGAGVRWRDRGARPERPAQPRPAGAAAGGRRPRAGAGDGGRDAGDVRGVRSAVPRGSAGDRVAAAPTQGDAAHAGAAVGGDRRAGLGDTGRRGVLRGGA